MKKTTYALANSFYASLSQQGSEAWKTFCTQMNNAEPPTAPEVPPIKPGFGVEKNLVIECPYYDTTATVHFVTFSNEYVFFCHEFDSPPDLLKPEILQATWLHLHLAILLACHQQMFTPQALLTTRVVPLIYGMKKQPQTNFPLASAALKHHLDMVCELNDLPF